MDFSSSIPEEWLLKDDVSSDEKGTYSSSDRDFVPNDLGFYIFLGYLAISVHAIIYCINEIYQSVKDFEFQNFHAIKCEF